MAPLGVGSVIPILAIPISSSDGRGRPERNPPEMKEIVVENWCYLAMVYTFGKEAEIPEIF